MESRELSSDEFAAFAKDYVLFCHITTRIEGEKHGKLLSEKGGTGFPTFLFLDADGEILLKHGIARTVENFGASGRKAQAMLDLAAKASKGDAKARVELFLARLDAGSISVADARKEIEGAKLAPEQRKRADALVLNLEVLELAGAARGTESQSSLGKKFWTWHSQKQTPTGERALDSFWSTILVFGESEKDVKAFRAGVEYFRARYGKVEARKSYLEKLDERLKKLESGG